MIDEDFGICRTEYVECPKGEYDIKFIKENLGFLPFCDDCNQKEICRKSVGEERKRNLGFY